MNYFHFFHFFVALYEIVSYIISVERLILNKTKEFKMNAMELRNKVSGMTKAEMVELRDFMEARWTEKMRESMQVLSLACINKFGTTLSTLES